MLTWAHSVLALYGLAAWHTPCKHDATRQRVRDQEQMIADGTNGVQLNCIDYVRGRLQRTARKGAGLTVVAFRSAQVSWSYLPMAHCVQGPGTVQQYTFLPVRTPALQSEAEVCNSASTIHARSW